MSPAGTRQQRREGLARVLSPRRISEASFQRGQVFGELKREVDAASVRISHRIIEPQFHSPVSLYTWVEHDRLSAGRQASLRLPRPLYIQRAGAR